LGLAHQPILGETWMHVASGTTYFNGNHTSTSDCDILSRASISTTSPNLFSAAKKHQFDRLQQACNIDVYGSDAYAYLMLASGYIDIVCESGLKPHDVMALLPIIEGAGGVITDWEGAPIVFDSSNNAIDVLAVANHTLHKQALDVLKG